MEGNNGNIGIGTDTPNANLVVHDDDYATLWLTGIAGSENSSELRFAERGDGDFGFAFHYEGGGGGDPNTNRMIIRSGTTSFTDRVIIERDSTAMGIGIVPLDMFHVNADIRVGSGTTGCVKDADGTNIAGTCSSDMRYKKDVRPLYAVSEKIAQLKPSRYFWRMDEFPDKHFGSEEQVGLIAQEVKEILPELVTVDDEGFYRVKYNDLNMFMLQAIIEQHQGLQNNLSMYNSMKGINDRQDQDISDNKRRIASLEEENSEIKSENDKLKKQNQELEERLKLIEEKLGL